MKTSKYFFMLSAALLGAACSDIIESSESVSFPEKEIIMTATREGLQPGTRSFRLDDGTVWWGPKEEISVFYGSGANGGSKFTSNNTTLAETTEFEGSISMSGNKEFWAAYPYSPENSCDGSSVVTVIPSQQTGSEGNFSNDAFPALGKSSSLTMPFWNICGGIKFFLSRSDIKSISFKGNSGETLAGKVRVSFSADRKPEVVEVLEGKTEVTLNAPDGGTFKAGKYYYLTLLPTALDGGFTMTFNTTDGKGIVTSDKAQTVKRSVFGTLKNIDAKVSEWESTMVEPEWVDLGLSVKWATFNVGASAPEEYGDYFAWGETEPKKDYSWSTYKWCNGSITTLTKYVTDSYFDTVDNKTVLDPEDDAAHVNWGGSWRMPTQKEWSELMNNCSWMWTSDYNGTGVAGNIITSNKPGYTDKSIFLPAAGYRSGSDIDGVGLGGYYCSSFLGDTNDGAWFVWFGSNNKGKRCYYRSGGYSIRPVYVSPSTLFSAEWLFSAENLAQYADTFGGTAGKKDTNAGDGGCYVNSNLTYGGCLSYVQVEKGTIDVDQRSSRIVGGTGHPVVTGPWIGDYWLFTISNGEEQPVGAQAHIRYITRTSRNGPKYWMIEYNDGNAWKPAAEVKKDGDIEYNLQMEADGSTNVEVDVTFSLAKATKEVQFRQRCVTVEQASGNGPLTKPTLGTSRIAGQETTGDCPVFELIANNNPGTPVSDIILNKTTLTLKAGESDVLTANPQPSNASDKTVTWNSSNPFVVTVDQTGRVTAIREGTATIVATVSARKAAATVEVVAPTAEAVDLGLSVKWATMNVGATKPEEYGEYFAWGETEPYYEIGYSQSDSPVWKSGKESGYDWPSYKYGKGEQMLVKYCPKNKSGYWEGQGEPDGLTKLAPDDDAAHVNWGGNWRMPTVSEWSELEEYCTWTWTDNYNGTGITGEIITRSKAGYEDRSIFLPAAGERRYTTSYDLSVSSGNYWSSSLYIYGPNNAWHVYFSKNDVGYDAYTAGYRTYGKLIRPVCPKD